MSSEFKTEGQDGFLDQIRLTRAELEKLVDAIAKPDGGTRQDSRRASARFRLTKLDLIVMHPGGSEARFRVHSIDVSATGMGFLHTGFLHEGSTCRIFLAKEGGEQIALTGIVANCSYVGHNLHRIGMEFERPIDLDRLLDPSDAGCDSISGLVVHIEQIEATRLLAEHELRSTEIEVVGYPTPEEAARFLKTRDAERVLLDVATVEEAASEAIDSINGAGYLNPILLTTSNPRSPALLELKEMAGPVLQKPFSAVELIKFLADNWPGEEDEQAEEDGTEANLLRIITRYAEQVHKFARDLDDATLGADFERTLRVCHRLKGSGASFGFPDITAVASEAIKALYAGQDLLEATAELRRVREVCAKISIRNSTRLQGDETD